MRAQLASLAALLQVGVRNKSAASRDYWLLERVYRVS
jgi:hypothetical protein